MDREKLSVTIITLNEEKNIRECLESVKWADEIIVVDSGSSDKTVRMCREYTDKIFVNPWPGHKEQKNYAISKASNLWIFSIDADERATEELRAFILEELKNPLFDGYRFSRKNYFLGKWMRYGGWYPDHVLRLFRQDKGCFGGINPHDQVIVKTGKVSIIDIPLIHYTYENLSRYIDKQNSYSNIAAQENLRAKPFIKIGLLAIFFKTLWKFTETYLLKRGFLDGFHGFLAAVGAAFTTFWKYAKLWELSRNK